MGNFTSSRYFKAGDDLRKEQYVNCINDYARRLEKLEDAVSGLQQSFKRLEKDTGDGKEKSRVIELRNQRIADVLPDAVEVDVDDRRPGDGEIHGVISEVVQKNASTTMPEMQEEDKCDVSDGAEHPDGDLSMMTDVGDRETIDREQSTPEMPPNCDKIRVFECKTDPKAAAEATYVGNPVHRDMGLNVENQNKTVGGHRRTSPDGMELIKQIRPQTKESHNLQETVVTCKAGGYGTLDVLPEAGEVEVESKISGFGQWQGIMLNVVDQNASAAMSLVEQDTNVPPGENKADDHGLTTEVDDQETVDRRNSLSKLSHNGEEPPGFEAKPEASVKAHHVEKLEGHVMALDVEQQSRAKGEGDSRKPPEGMEADRQNRDKGKDVGDVLCRGLEEHGHESISIQLSHIQDIQQVEGTQRKPPEGMESVEQKREVIQIIQETAVMGEQGELKSAKVHSHNVNVLGETETSDVWMRHGIMPHIAQQRAFTVMHVAGKLAMDRTDDLDVDKQTNYSRDEITERKVDGEQNLSVMLPNNGEMLGFSGKVVLKASVVQEDESLLVRKLESCKMTQPVHEQDAQRGLPKKQLDTTKSVKQKLEDGQSMQKKTRLVGVGEQGAPQVLLDAVHEQAIEERTTPDHGATHGIRSVVRQDDNFTGMTIPGEQDICDPSDADEQMNSGQVVMGDVGYWETVDGDQRVTTTAPDSVGRSRFSVKTEPKASSVKENDEPLVGNFEEGRMDQAVNKPDTKRRTPRKPLDQMESFKQKSEKLPNMQVMTIVDDSGKPRSTKVQSDAIEVVGEGKTPGSGSVDTILSDIVQQDASAATPVGGEQDKSDVRCFEEQTNHDQGFGNGEPGEEGISTMPMYRRLHALGCKNISASQEPVTQQNEILRVEKLENCEMYLDVDEQETDGEMSDEHKRVLRLMYTKLTDNVDMEGNLVPYLYQRGILKPADKEKIDTELMPSKKIQILLDALPKKGKDAFDGFCRGLEENGQRFISKALSNSGNMRHLNVMSAENKRVLRSLYTDLVDNVDMEGNLVLYLYQQGILQRHDKEKINTERRPSKKTQVLLDILPKKGIAAFDAFCRSLEENGQGFIVKRLSKSLNIRNSTYSPFNTQHDVF